MRGAPAFDRHSNAPLTCGQSCLETQDTPSLVCCQIVELKDVLEYEEQLLGLTPRHASVSTPSIV